MARDEELIGLVVTELQTAITAKEKGKNIGEERELLLSLLEALETQWGIEECASASSRLGKIDFRLFGMGELTDYFHRVSGLVDRFTSFAIPGGLGEEWMKKNKAYFSPLLFPNGPLLVSEGQIFYSRIMGNLRRASGNILRAMEMQREMRMGSRPALQGKPEQTRAQPSRAVHK